MSQEDNVLARKLPAPLCLVLSEIYIFQVETALTRRADLNQLFLSRHVFKETPDACGERASRGNLTGGESDAWNPLLHPEPV